METTLHRQLKQLYAGDDDQTEVPLGGFRIDAVTSEHLVEIQHGSLAAIRDKVAALLGEHDVLVVKPLVASKCLVRLDRRDGEEVSRRRSPKRGTLLNLFDDLVYFTSVFPHRRLTLEVVLVEIEEWRYPGRGRRRRRRDNDFQVADQRLVQLRETRRLRNATDLLKLIGCQLPQPFHSGDLATGLEIDRYRAQRVAYCLRQTGAIRQIGKAGNTLLYKFNKRVRCHVRQAAG